MLESTAKKENKLLEDNKENNKETHYAQIINHLYEKLIKEGLM